MEEIIVQLGGSSKGSLMGQTKERSVLGGGTQQSKMAAH